MTFLVSRRHLLRQAAVLGSGSLLAACSSPMPSSVRTVTPQPAHKPNPMPQQSQTASSQSSLHLFASSGFCEDSSRVQNGLNRLQSAGFSIDNPQAAFRRFQRFAGSDAERIADLQDVATGRIATPKVLMGVRGGYGAARLLPHIDWVQLGERMRERQTLLFGFSDVTAIQMALLAKGMMPSFAGPMLYSEFAKPQPDTYTMESFIRTTTAPTLTVNVAAYSAQRAPQVDGILWGGNLSVVASLVGTPYMPDVQGGLLFLEDVSEQPYRIERMLQTLHLAGILRRQRAIILGDFRMGNIRDSYDSSYTLNSVAQNISRIAGIPVLQGFPFGHITNKTTFPLGAHAQLRESGAGYSITFSQYPTLNPAGLSLNMLLPPPPETLVILPKARPIPTANFNSATKKQPALYPTKCRLLLDGGFGLLPVQQRIAQCFAAGDEFLRHLAAQRADTADIGCPFGHRNRAARIQQVERVPRFEHQFVCR